MKKMVSLFFVLLATGCAPDELPAPPPPPVDWHSFEVASAKKAHPAPPPAVAKARPLAESYVAALLSPKMADLGALLDENAHAMLPNGDDVRGRDDVISAHRSLFEAFDDIKLAPTRILRGPEEQIVEWTFSGKATRPYMGADANGKTVVIQGLTVLFFRSDGVLTDVHVHFDTALALAQLGVGPKVLVDRPHPPFPTEPARVVGPEANPDGESRIKMVRASLDALANNDENGYVANMADDVELITQDKAEPTRGKNEMRSYARALHRSIAQLDTTVRSANAAGPFVVVEYQISGEQIGPIGWVPAEALRVPHIDVADVVEIDSGHIVRINRYDNRGSLLPAPSSKDEKASRDGKAKKP